MLQIKIEENRYFETVLHIDLLYTNLKYGKINKPVKNPRWSCPTGVSIDYLKRENTFSK